MTLVGSSGGGAEGTFWLPLAPKVTLKINLLPRQILHAAGTTETFRPFGRAAVAESCGSHFYEKLVRVYVLIERRPPITPPKHTLWSTSGATLSPWALFGPSRWSPKLCMPLRWGAQVSKRGAPARAVVAPFWRFAPRAWRSDGFDTTWTSF